MSKRTKTQLTKDAFVAYGAEDSGDDEHEMNPPQIASQAVMAGRKIAGMGRRFGAKKVQAGKAAATVPSALADKVQLSQMRSLNANFLKSVNDGITKNPVADLTAICTKYLDYVTKVNDKKIEVKKMDVPKVDINPESVKTEGKANPFAMFAPAINNNNAPATAKLNSGVDTKFGKPAEIAQAPAKAAATEAAKADEESEDDDDEKAKRPVKLEGPKFVLNELPKSKNYGFQFGKAPPKDDDDSEDEIEIKGPSFISTAKVSDSNFKFPPKTNDKKDTKPEDVAPETKPSNGFSFGSASSASTSKPAFSFNLPASSDKQTAETNKVSFNFGAASKPSNETKPAFSFGAAQSSTPSFSFGAAKLPATTTANNTTAPVLNFGQKATPSSAFSFGSTSSTTTESKPTFNANSVFSFGKTSDTSSTASNPFNIGKPTTFGNNTSPVFNFSANTPSSTTNNEPSVTAKNTEENDHPDEANEAENDTVKGNFAVVHLTEKVEVKTGEEEEESLYVKRSKITRFNSETNGYDPVGLGELKVLKNKATGKCRILVRSEGSSNVLLNVAILEEMKYELLGDKKSMLRIPSVNADGTLVTYVARVKTATDGEELLKAVKSCQ
ncbi:hypothetical protein PMKS-003012 [Pichia membranifaciens]|uniref:RanBD1 domain-containing protein n=1 Tax=Pichia membranifaciens TaxID=4926 RepID=A0A1Q2YJ61_9ASCO|nr:hypothetical protein PMKS-003012 [Pichia membranifaciens]